MAAIRTVLFEEKLATGWDEFIDRSINGTIFHKQKFISYHPAERFDDQSLLFYEKDKIWSVFPAAILEREGKKIIKSHPGTSYGGLVFDRKVPLRKVFSMLEKLEEHCRSLAINRIEFRLPPKLFNRFFIDQLDFALRWNGYEIETQELATYYILDDYLLEEDFEKFIEQFPVTSRKEIKKGFKQGVTCGIPETKAEWTKFHDILRKNLQDKYEVNPAHSLDEMIWLIENFENEIFIYGTYFNDQLIGGYLVMKISPGKYHIFYSCIEYDYQIYRPVNFALAQLIWHLKKEGAQILNYGVSTPYGESINWGLLKFKEDFGGTGCLRNYWVKDLADEQ